MIVPDTREISHSKIYIEYTRAARCFFFLFLPFKNFNTRKTRAKNASRKHFLRVSLSLLFMRVARGSQLRNGFDRKIMISINHTTRQIDIVVVRNKFVCVRRHTHRRGSTRARARFQMSNFDRVICVCVCCVARDPKGDAVDRGLICVHFESRCGPSGIDGSASTLSFIA